MRENHRLSSEKHAVGIKVGRPKGIDNKSHFVYNGVNFRKAHSVAYADYSLSNK